MLRSTTAVTLLGIGSLALPATAPAATATLDRPCYVGGQAGQLALAGFAPNAALTVANAELGPAAVTTDVTGSWTLGFRPPDGSELQQPGSRAFTMTATEDANPASTAAATSRYAPLAFATSGETSSPKALRRWRFSGFVPGKRIYAHFRLGGRTRGTYRFGLAKGPCGEDTRRAPGIAVKGRVATGTWVVQVDQQATYSKTAVPRVSAKAPVFNRFRPRATAARAGAARPAASAGAPRFGGVRS